MPLRKVGRSELVQACEELGCHYLTLHRLLEWALAVLALFCLALLAFWRACRRCGIEGTVSVNGKKG